MISDSTSPRPAIATATSAAKPPVPGAIPKTDSADKKIQGGAANPLFLSLKDVKADEARSPREVKISATNSTGTQYSGEDIHKKLSEIYLKYEGSGKKLARRKSQRMMSKILPGGSGISRSQSIKDGSDKQHEIEMIIQIIQKAQGKGFKSFEVSDNEAIKTIKLDTLLKLIIGSDDVQQLIDESKAFKMNLHAFILDFVLFSIKVYAVDFHEFLLQFNNSMSDLMKIFGRSYEFSGPDGKGINLFDRFVNSNSAVCLLKPVGMARLNYELIMAAARKGANKEKIQLGEAHEREFKLQDTKIIFSEAEEIRKALITSLNPPLKCVRTVIERLLDTYCIFFSTMGRELERQLVEGMRTSFKVAWPDEASERQLDIHWDGALRITKELVDFIKANAKLARKAEWVNRCLCDHSAGDIRKRMYAIGDDLVASVEIFFKDLSVDERRKLVTFIDKRAEALATILKADEVKVQLIRIKAAQIKDVLNKEPSLAMP